MPIGSLRPEARVAVEGEIELAEVVFRRRRTLLVRLSDGTGFLTLRFFYFTGAQQQQLARGTRLRCFGEVRRGPVGLEIVHPEYRLADAPDKQAVVDALTPVYPATEGIQQGRLRNLTAQALAALADGELPDLLPPEVQHELKLPGLREALQFLHRPPPETRLELLEDGRHPAQRRLAFEELLAQQLSLRALRNEIRRDPGWPLVVPGKLAARLLETIGFALDQGPDSRRCRDQGGPAAASPMLRLVQGDVGSRQDHRRGARRIDRHRGGLPGGADGADRTARRTALRRISRAGSRRSRIEPLLADRAPGREGAPGRARGHGERRMPARDRHARPASRKGSASRGSRSSSWTSSIASACTSVWRCATRARRAAIRTS